MSEGFQFKVPDDPHQQNEMFVRLFNHGDGKLYDSMYTDDAVSNISGAPLTGPARTQFFEQFLASGPKIDSKVTAAFTTSDTSLLIVDYTMTISGEDGEAVSVHGQCTDVLVRNAEGQWRLAVDRPVADAHAG